MSQSSVEAFLGRLITDPDFRELVESDFARVCFEHGIELTLAEKAILRSIDLLPFRRVSALLDGRIKRSRRTLGREIEKRGEVEC